LGIYGVYENRVSDQNDGFYNETVFVMMNDIEIFMYAVGASFPGMALRQNSGGVFIRGLTDHLVLSRYLVSRSDPSGAAHSNFSSFARHVPDFFRPETSLNRTHRPLSSTASHPGSQSSVVMHNKEDQNITDTCHDDIEGKSPVASVSSMGEQT
jgi:hypothetical protein